MKSGFMRTTRGAVHRSELLEKRREMETRRKSIAIEVLLSSRGVGGCKVNVHQYIVPLEAREKCLIKVSGIRGTS